MRSRDIDQIAEKVVASLREDRRATLLAERRRGLWGLALLTLAAVTTMAGLFFLQLRDRPPVHAVLSASALAEGGIVIRGYHPSLEDFVEAQLKALVLNSGGKDSTSAELDIPVPSTECGRLVAAVGGTCDGQRGQPTPVSSPLVLRWSRSVLLSLAADDLQALRLSPFDPTGKGQLLGAWDAELDAGAARLKIDCLVDSSLSMVRAGGGRPLTVDCGSTDTASWRLPVRFRDGQTSGMSLSGLYALYAHIDGQAGRIDVRDGQLQLDRSIREEHAPRGSVFTIRSGKPRGVTLDVEGVGSFDRVRVSLDSEAATSVRQGREEQVATEFSRNSDTWLALLIAVVLGLAGAWARQLFINR